VGTDRLWFCAMETNYTEAIKVAERLRGSVKNGFAEVVFGWSFYRQGTSGDTSSGD
jgi:hypothetical protein